MGRKLLGNIKTVVEEEALWGDGLEKEERKCKDGNSWSLIERNQ